MREINWAEPFDKPLSGAAKGVLATMMCLPESDYLTAEELYSRFKADPPMVIDDAIAELMSEDTANCTEHFYDIAAPCTIIITITPQGWTPVLSWDIMYLQ